MQERDEPASSVPAAAPARTRPSRRGYFVPGAIALAALLGIGTAFGAGDLVHQAPRVLSGPEVAAQVELGLQAELNSVNQPYVTCPSSEPVKAGLTFTCFERPIGGPARPIPVSEIDAHGQLRFGLPGS